MAAPIQRGHAGPAPCPSGGVSQAAEPGEELPQFPVDRLPIGVEGALQEVGPGRCHASAIRRVPPVGKRRVPVGAEVRGRSNIPRCRPEDLQPRGRAGRPTRPPAGRRSHIPGPGPARPSGPTTRPEGLARDMLTGTIPPGAQPTKEAAPGGSVASPPPRPAIISARSRAVAGQVALMRDRCSARPARSGSRSSLEPISGRWVACSIRPRPKYSVGGGGRAGSFSSPGLAVAGLVVRARSPPCPRGGVVSGRATADESTSAEPWISVGELEIRGPDRSHRAEQAPPLQSFHRRPTRPAAMARPPFHPFHDCAIAMFRMVSTFVTSRPGMPPCDWTGTNHAGGGKCGGLLVPVRASRRRRIPTSSGPLTRTST